MDVGSGGNQVHYMDLLFERCDFIDIKTKSGTSAAWYFSWRKVTSGTHPPYNLVFKKCTFRTQVTAAQLMDSIFNYFDSTVDSTVEFIDCIVVARGGAIKFSKGTGTWAPTVANLIVAPTARVTDIPTTTNLITQDPEFEDELNNVLIPKLNSPGFGEGSTVL